jgi:hypothetical protein
MQAARIGFSCRFGSIFPDRFVSPESKWHRHLARDSGRFRVRSAFVKMLGTEYPEGIA